jgi:hypothetical protein
MAPKKTNKKTKSMNYLGVPGSSASGKFDNSLYTPSQVVIRNMADGPITVDSAGENVAPFEGTPSTTNPDYIPVSDPRFQRQADLKEQALADAASGKPTGTTLKPTTPAGQGGGKDDEPPAAPAAPAAPASKEGPTTETRNAFALIKETLALYGLEELASTVEQFMKEGVPAQEGLLRLKTDTDKNPITGKPYNEPYVKRFAGNEARRAAGLNVYSEGEYLASEDSFTQSLRAYGQADFFGKTKEEKRAEAAKYIGGDMSAKEFDDVLNLVVNEVKNKDPYTKAAMKQLYGIEEADLVKYFLNPEKNLPDLQQKAQAAQIGGAALMQGVDAKGENLLSIGNSMGLAKLGVTQAQAQEGYGKIAEVLPTAQKLGNIYNEEKIAYTQGTAEEETFQNLASAKRKRMQLANKEIGSFSADSGRGKGALLFTYINIES